MVFSYDRVWLFWSDPVQVTGLYAIQLLTLYSPIAKAECEAEHTYAVLFCWAG